MRRFYFQFFQLTNIFLIFFLVLFTFGVSYSKTSFYLPYQGFLMPDALEASFHRPVVGQVFQNMAWLSDVREAQFKLDTSSQFLGYDRLVFAGASYFKNFTFGFGYLSYGADDLYRGTLVSQGKADIQDRFSHRFHVFKWGVACPVNVFDFGASLSYYSLLLDRYSADAFSFDVGFLYWVDRTMWLGAYTRHLWPMHFDLQADTSYVDRSDMALVLEGGYLYRDILFKFLTDFSDLRLYSDFLFLSRFYLNGDIVFNLSDSFDCSRIGIGVDLPLNSFYLSYNYLHSFVDQLDSQQHLLGVTFFKFFG